MNAVACFAVFAAMALDPSAASEEPTHESGLVEEVEVIATRLPDQPQDVRDVPAHVTTISREQIERSGARTLQDLLILEAGAVLYDQVGNDIEKTFDLRGFTGGSATKVFLDGAPINDTRNNTLGLHQIPLDAVERIEITRGTAATLAGGGSQAGVIHLLTRQGNGLAGSVALGGGTFDTTELSGAIHGGSGRFDFYLSGSREETDGFRDNAGGDLRRLAATFGLDLPHERRLELSIVDGRSDLGNPGALTLQELQIDPTASPYNRPDFADRRFDQASLNARGVLTGPFSFAANLFVRERDVEILTTGRAAAAGFGGFLAGLEESAVGSTLQVSHRHLSPRAENQVTAGLEWLEGDTDALGFDTLAGDPTQIDSSVPPSRNRSERTTVALFVQDTWRPLPAWSFVAGARLDRDSIDFTSFSPGQLESDSLDFSEVSFRTGANWTPSDRWGLNVSYGEGFGPPTPEQLFAFSFFGGNPGLRPEDSRNYEVGVHGRWSHGLSVDAVLFRIETTDEIIFDPDSPLGPFGANENAGETRRDGIEASFRASPTPRLHLFANLTLIDAEFRNGPDAGNEVPLVPGERFGVGLDVDFPARVTLHADALRVGKQVLDNDEPNEQPQLAAYSVVNTRVTWSPPLPGPTRGDGNRGLVLFAECRNLFDERYATRGIYAFDFTTFESAIFLTPAPGRRYLAGAEWKF